MITKSRNLLIGFLLMIAMLLGVFAMTPLTAFAISDADKPAETIYVGGVALNAGQYVKNGETTATTGEPDWEESGFAFYASSGTFHLSDYEYEGTGYTHDTTEKSVIYSTGKLEVILHGTSSIKNTADKSIWSANGIRVKGNLVVDGPGTITVNAPYAIYGDALVKFLYGKTLIPDATIAIEAGGNFIVDGGYVELHSTQPIIAYASFISGGSFIATAEQGVFKAAPTISVDTEDEYSLYICTDVAGNNQVAYEPDKITQYKYFAVLPPTLTEIDSVSVSGVVLPTLGGKVGDASYAAATCGTGYFVFDMYVDKLVGDTWVALEDTASIVAGVKYRVVLGIDTEEGYTISADIAGANVLINGQQATKHEIFAYPDYNSIDIYYEFSYTATTTPITSISVSGLTLPAAGQTSADWDFNPGMLTFGGNYDFDDCGMKKYTGTEWVAMGPDDTTILTNVKYRFFIELSADEGYSFSPELTSDDVTIGDYDAVLLEVDPSGEFATVAVEFYYEASSATPITSISVSGADLPEVGETADDMEFTPTSLTYGGAYQMTGISIEKYTGTNWVFYSGSDDVIEAGVRYRLIITLMPTGTDAFAELLTSDDVTFNGKDAEFLGFVNAGTAKYAQIALEFSYEAPVTDYGITIADKDDSGATVGVLITEENCTDVLGDGTVSYDPTTNTLTLNGYKYEGEGFLSGSDYYYGICVTEFFDDLTVVLAGENVITMTDSGTGMMHEPYYTGIELWNGNMTIKGDGSLAISSPGDGICVYGGEDGRGVLEIKGGSITIEGDDEGIYTDNSFKMTGGSLTVGATYGIYTYVFEMNGGSITVNAVADYAPGAICAYESFLMNGGTITASATGENAYTIYLEGDFTMNGGSLKLSADCDGIILWEDSSIVVSGGTLEISTKEAGHAFIRNTESDGAVSIVPTVTGDYSMTASVNEDGSSAVIYDEDAHETYKYVKIAFVTKYGITIADKDESGATVGVEITSENCTDVLGDGTVSYDPTTNTLTLNGYKYEGEGVYFEEQGAFFCLMADVPTEGLTIVLVGDNMISVSGNGSAGMMFFEGEGDDLTIKGNGSLAINAVMYGIALQADNGRLTIEGGVIDIIITGTMSVGIQAADFVMMDADLKITTAMLGIAAYSEDGICINGGSLEIDTTMGGYAFVCVDFEHMAFIPIMADLSGYVGAYKMTAGIKQDGSDATDFDEEYLSSYKYVKVEPTHVHDHGTAWESDANEHWNECECGDKANKAAHTDSDTNGKCDVCGADVPVAPPSHTHDYGTTWKTDENNHWNECECGDKANTAPHADENNDGKCDTCDYAMGNADNPGGDKESEKTGLSGGAIAGIAVGSVAVVGLGGFSLFWFVIKKKKFADLIALFKKK